MHTSSSLNALVQAMETMAFITPTLADASLSPSADSILVSMPFTGPICGTVEMVASEAAGIGLAANILATNPEDPSAKCYAQDALKELLNVTCGLLLPTLTTDQSKSIPFKMTLPHVNCFDSQNQWCHFMATNDSCALDVDGELIALRVKCD